MNDDDEVGFDLTAWEAPPPSAGLADAVIARVSAPPVAGAVEAAPPRSSRWWIAGGIAAVIVGAISIALLARGGEEVTGGSGAVATAKPSHLQLGGTAIDLEANTDVWWTRDGKQTVAHQPRGKATWKVAANEELVINTGAMGASVRASGASLRVEVDMNLSDARLIGTSAATAAAVALVTVIVYEGHVKVTSADRTVEVPAGTTVQVAPNKPPVEPDVISGREKRLESKVKFLELENELLRKKLEPSWLGPQDISAFNKVMIAIANDLKKCRLGSTASEMNVRIDVHDDHSLKIGIDAQPAVKQPVFECVDTLVSKVDLSKLKVGAYSYVVGFDAPPIVPGPVTVARPPVTVDPTPPKDCDDKATLDKREKKGDELLSMGNFAAGLATFSEMLSCRPRIATKAYLAACKARNFPKAKELFKLVGRDALAQICLKEGFDPR